MAETEKAAIVKQILDSRREFTFEDADGNETHYFISPPSGEDIRKADWNYAKVFNQALEDGFPTQAQMTETLTKRGILGDEYNRQLEKNRMDLVAGLFRLEHLSDGASDAEKEMLALEVKRLRNELFRLTQKVNGPMGNTCENMGEDSRAIYLTSRMVQKKDGSRLWASFEDYLKEPNNGLAIQARFEVMLWMQGLEANFLDNTPEQITLRSLAEKRLNETLEAAKGEAAPSSQPAAEPVEDIELPDDPKPKKRGRQPKAK